MFFLSKIQNHLQFTKQHKYLAIGITIALTLYFSILIWGIEGIGQLTEPMSGTLIDGGASAKESQFPSLTSLIFGISVATVLYTTYRLESWLGFISSLSLTLALFALPLAGLWSSGNSDPWAFAALFPYLDADHFYGSALKLLEGELMGSFASRRPYFPGMFAALLGLTRQNLQMSLAILGAVAGICSFLLAREIRKSLGTVASVISLLCLFLFCKPYLGQVLTEVPGFFLGTLGLAFLWQGARKAKIYPCLLGLLALTIGLLTRAGAFLVLPTILLWGMLFFRGKARLSYHFLVGGISAILLGFIFNSIILKVCAIPNAVANSNFPHVLYGLVTGTDSWGQIWTDYPETLQGSYSDSANFIYSKVFEIILDDPLTLVRGYFRLIPKFLFMPDISHFRTFSFVFIYNTYAESILGFFAIVGCGICLVQWRKPINSLLISSFIGFVISIPFVAPGIGGIRVYAATIAISIAFIAVGISFAMNVISRLRVAIAQQTKFSRLSGLISPQILSLFPLKKQSDLVQNTLDRLPLLVFGYAIIGFFMFSPLITHLISHKPQFKDITCPENMRVVDFRSPQGSFVNIVNDNDITRTYLPNIRISDFRNGLDKWISLGDRDWGAARTISNLESPHIVQLIFNLRVHSLGGYALIDDELDIPHDGSIVGVCGEYKEFEDYHMFVVKSLQPKN